GVASFRAPGGVRGEPNAAVQATVLKRLDDRDWNVRIQLAATLGALPQSARDAALIALLERSANDPMTVDAVLSGIRGREAALLEKMLESTAQTPQRDAAIAMLAATVMKSGQQAPVQNVIQWITQSTRAEWQRVGPSRGGGGGVGGGARRA